MLIIFFHPDEYPTSFVCANIDNHLTGIDKTMQIPLKDMTFPQAVFEPGQQVIETVLSDDELDEYICYIGVSKEEYASHKAGFNCEQYLRSYRWLVESKAIKRLTLSDWLAPYSSTSIGLSAMAIMSSASLYDGLKLAVKYTPLFMPVLKTVLEENGDSIRVHFEIHSDLTEMKPFLLELIAGVANTITVELVNNSIIQEVHFCHDNTTFGNAGFEQEDYNKLFGCPVYFNSNFDGVVVKTSALSTSFTKPNKATHEQTKGLLESQLESYAQPETFIGKARAVLESFAKEGKYIGLDLLAETMNLTPRTLSRKLLKDGSHFKTLANDVRFSIAKEQLSRTNKPLKQIAISAGFKNSESFSRAFKTEFGETPSGWREDKS